MEKTDFIKYVRNFVCELLKHENISVEMKEERNIGVALHYDIDTFNLKISCANICNTMKEEYDNER